MNPTILCPWHPAYGYNLLPLHWFASIFDGHLACHPGIATLTLHDRVQWPILHRVDFRSGFKTVRRLSDLSRIFPLHCSCADWGMTNCFSNCLTNLIATYRTPLETAWTRGPYFSHPWMHRAQLEPCPGPTVTHPLRHSH